MSDQTEASRFVCGTATNFFLTITLLAGNRQNFSTFFQSHIHLLRRLSPNLCIESCKMQEAAIVCEYVSYVRVMLTAFFSEVFPLNI